MVRPIFIIGSCATRDAFEISPHNFQLVEYIARTSFASSFCDESFNLDGEFLNWQKVTSKWQQSMVECDLGRKLPEKILEQASKSPVLLIDFIDERFSLMMVGNAVATMSAEYNKIFDTDSIVERRVIRSTTDEHFALWSKGFGRLFDLSKKLNLKVVVNQVYWSDELEDGAPFRFASGYISLMNDYLDRMYDFVKELGVERISYPKELLKGAKQHKWGQDPYHYTENVYLHLLKKLGECLENDLCESQK